MYSWKCIFFAVLVCCHIELESAANEGSGNSLTVPEDAVSNGTCTIPIYSQPSYEVNATDENLRLLVTEGRCFLRCIEYTTFPHNVSHEKLFCCTSKDTKFIIALVIKSRRKYGSMNMEHVF